mmetsp:Transcript_14090/g.41314  ORF Transcript_14090/g.41314 Transcript_14090/m.41314 type:complete len:493 (-) Transcript_14090:559-2037(-)
MKVLEIDGVHEKKTMLVPPFWDPPILAQYGGIREYLGSYGTRLMTPAEARSVGSVITKQRVDGTVEELETILVTITSYRDWMCPQSIEIMLSRAVHPERVRVAVVDQLNIHDSDMGDADTSCDQPLISCSDKPQQAFCLHRDHIDVMQIDAREATGPILGRHLANRMYRGESFVLQSDAHVQFATGWDVDVIDQWRSTKNEMAVLTSYVSGVQGKIDEETGEPLVNTRPILCEEIWEDEGLEKHLQHDEQPDYAPDIKGSPQLEPFWAAGFSFARGHFVVNVPYDLHAPFVFQGEEISIGVRGFTYGYDYYAPERNILFHYYDRPPNPYEKQVTAEKENKPPKFWNANNYDEDIEAMAILRLNKIIHSISPSWIDTLENKMSSDAPHLFWDEEKYGIGTVRSPEKFYQTFGIDVQNQTMEMNLCMFVASPDMHNLFVKGLRENGMGIDYDRLDGFRYKNQYPKKYWWWYNGDNPSEEGEGLVEEVEEPEEEE